MNVHYTLDAKDAAQAAKRVAKTGAQHIASLNDGRVVLLDGQRVNDITKSTAFQNIARTSGRYYDLQSAPANIDQMMFKPEGAEKLTGRAWHLPTSHEELVQRRRVLETISRSTCGMMGRSPDHVASTLSGIYMGLDVLGKQDGARTHAFADYFHYARQNDLFLTYTIINPQADRSKTAGGQPQRDLVAQVVDRNEEGIVIRGAKMLGTSAVVANELLISCIQPLTEDDKDFAFTAAIPLNTPGVKMLSRRSYEQHATSEFDYPLAYNFDENDAVVLFEDVLIPWSRVFVLDSPQALAAQFYQTPAHVYQNYQCIVRFTVKVRFLLGLARKIADVNGTINFPQVKDMLGALAAKVSLMEGVVAGMEVQGSLHNGYYIPNRQMLCAAQATAQLMYPQIIDAIRDLSGGGVIMLPSSVEDIDNEETWSLLERSQMSPRVNSIQRIKFFKLVWDAIGSEFGSRHLQYEKFYSGAQFVLNGHNFRNFDWASATDMVDGFMESYAHPREKAGS
jgi:4-hydroxyphenylacetate 3-monooxygenase